MSSTRLALVCGAVMVITGCGSTYYRVTDPTTDHSYYTTKIDHQRSGAVTLRDASTGNVVTLQNSEVQEVKKEEFETGRVRRELAPAETTGDSR